MLYKTYLVAQGFSQILNCDYKEIYSLVACYDSLWLLFYLVTVFGFDVKQSDVDTTYLYNILKQEIWMKLPPNFERNRHHALLKHCFYNLK